MNRQVAGDDDSLRKVFLCYYVIAKKLLRQGGKACFVTVLVICICDFVITGEVKGKVSDGVESL